MKRNFIFNSILFFLIFFSLAVFFPGRVKGQVPEVQDEQVRINRLIGLCKLWGAVKYFHPALAYRNDIDWDAALINTIPKVNASKTSVEYQSAVQEMLDVLQDKATRVLNSSVSNAASQNNTKNKELESSLTEDNVLVITINNYFSLFNPKAQEKLNAIASEIGKARAVIFDLRSAQSANVFSGNLLRSRFLQIERLIVSSQLVSPGERKRIYHGFEAQNGGGGSGGYESGFYLKNGERITPAPKAVDIPAIFLLNKNSALLNSTLAMQAKGKAAVVFDGDSSEASFITTEDIQLDRYTLARVRLGELVFEDGTLGEEIEPDVSVSSSQDGVDRAFEAALKMSRSFKPSTSVRKKIAGSSAPIAEKIYPEMNYPSPEYRILAAFRIWNVFNYFFPYKRLMGENWTDVLRSSLPSFEQAGNSREYALAVSKMLAHVHDSHVSRAFGRSMYEVFPLGYPPLKIRVIEGSPVITGFTDEAAAKDAGVEIGDIVLKVDGEDAKTRLNWFAKYISASTPQAQMYDAANLFLNGSEGSALTLTIRDNSNRLKDVKLMRKRGYRSPDHTERSGDIIKMLPGNIGYADLDRMTVEMIDDMFEKFKNTKAIIFDMRGYPNGIAWPLAPRLADKPGSQAALFERPLVGQSLYAELFESFYQTIAPLPTGAWTYKGKTVMLIDERSISQSEHTGLFLRAANGTKFVGSPTAGANGDTTLFFIPGAISVSFTGQSVRFPDGKQLQRIGLVPDVEVKPTIKGIREGKDEVLEKAIQFLKEKR